MISYILTSLWIHHEQNHEYEDSENQNRCDPETPAPVPRQIGHPSGHNVAKTTLWKKEKGKKAFIRMQGELYNTF